MNMVQRVITFRKIENTQAFLYLLIPSQYIYLLLLEDWEMWVDDSELFIKNNLKYAIELKLLQIQKFKAMKTILKYRGFAKNCSVSQWNWDRKRKKLVSCSEFLKTGFIIKTHSWVHLPRPESSICSQGKALIGFEKLLLVLGAEGHACRLPPTPARWPLQFPVVTWPSQLRLASGRHGHRSIQCSCSQNLFFTSCWVWVWWVQFCIFAPAARCWRCWDRLWPLPGSIIVSREMQNIQRWRHVECWCWGSCRGRARKNRGREQAQMGKASWEMGTALAKAPEHGECEPEEKRWFRWVARWPGVLIRRWNCKCRLGLIFTFYLLSLFGFVFSSIYSASLTN